METTIKRPVIKMLIETRFISGMKLLFWRLLVWLRIKELVVSMSRSLPDLGIQVKIHVQHVSGPT